LVVELSEDEEWCPKCGGLGVVDDEHTSVGEAPPCDICGQTGTVDEETAEDYENSKG